MSINVLLMTTEVISLVYEYADIKRHIHTGSAVICTPPVEDTDVDIVVIYCGMLSAALQAANYEVSPHGEYPNQEINACYRKGRVNVIAVRDEDSFNKWVKATQLAAMMNLKEKNQRMLLFQFITEGVTRGPNPIWYNAPPKQTELTELSF